ncbi:MAG: hypothetical protein ACREME_05915 [Gemmatimonadales bacterium]
MILLALSLCAALQDSTAADTTPFRRGQWAAQFGVGFSFASLGFMTFRSPTSAWVVDLRVSGGHNEALATDSAGTRFLGLDSRAVVDVRLGIRTHRAETKKVVPFYSVGVLGGFTHVGFSSGGGSGQRDGWSAGVFADVGANYLFTPHFAIAATGTLTLRYATETRQQTGSPRIRTWGLSGSAPGAALLLLLYF